MPFDIMTIWRTLSICLQTLIAQEYYTNARVTFIVDWIWMWSMFIDGHSSLNVLIFFPLLCFCFLLYFKFWFLTFVIVTFAYISTAIFLSCHLHIIIFFKLIFWYGLHKSCFLFFLQCLDKKFGDLPKSLSS